MSVPPLLQPIQYLTGPLRFPVGEVEAAFSRRELARGETWLPVGATCRKIAYVESGLLRYVQEHEGVLLTRWATLPGQYGFAAKSYLQQAPTLVSVEAAEPTVLYEIDRHPWMELRRNHAQLQEFWVTILEYNICCFEDRVWSLIAGDGEARYRYMIERYPEFLLNLPQHYVADMLGIAPRHLSRIRSKLSSGE